MAVKFPKSTNFFAASKGAADTAVTNLTSGAFGASVAGSWTWGSDDDWKDASSNRYVMNVAPNMSLKLLANRQFELTLPILTQYAKSHRFVYKLDAIDTSVAPKDLLLSFVIPVISHNVEFYGQADLSPTIIKGRFPRKIEIPANILWVRRGSGEYRA